MSKIACFIVAVIAAVALNSACTYDPVYTQLTCNVDQDCPQDAECREGLCVSTGVVAPDMSSDTDEPDDSLEAPIDRIEIEPTAAQVVAGTQLQLTATVYDADDAIVTDATVAWSSDTAEIATVDAMGLVDGVAEGTAEITATVGGVTASASITVVAPAATVEIEPAMPDPLPRGRTLTLTARAFDAQGVELPGRIATWTSSEPETVEVSEDGQAIALLVGSATITANIDGVTDTVEITVEDNDVARVAISPDEPTVLLNQIKVYDAIIYDSDDEILDPRNRTFVWEASNGAVISLSRQAADPDWSQRLQGLSVGSSTLSVEVDGVETADLDIEVVLPVVDSVTIVDPGVVPIGPTVTLTTIVQDPDGNMITGRPHTWTSSETGVATIDMSSGELTPVAPGTTTITVDVDGVSGTRDIDVRFYLEQISAGVEHTCGTAPDGGVYCWGDNSDGRLGIGMVSSTSEPTRVVTSSLYSEVHAGGRMSCALELGGAVHCWGAMGRTGAANGTRSATPRAVFGGRTYTKVATGADHACAIEDSGEVWCWGANARGQLGDNSTTDRNAPVQAQFSPAGTPVALALGAEHSCVLTDTPKVWCWGRGQFGALGDGGTGDEDTPVEVTSNEDFVEIAAGQQVSCGRTNADAVYCWGTNMSGELGIGDLNVSSSDTPRLLPGVSMSAISLGSSHGCGLDAANGEVQCWGDPAGYRLGNLDDQTVAAAPVANGANLLAKAVAAGNAHGCAVAQDNRPYCWGSNEFGQVGTTSNAQAQLPTLVWPAQ